MATLRDIKKRVKSVKNIAQITSAMQMVAASKMRRAQNRSTQFQPYAEKIARAVSELSEMVDRRLHKLLAEGNPQGKRLIIFITTNKGLCGALNSNLIRQLYQWYAHPSALEYVTVGKKGRDFVRRIGANLLADFSEKQPAVIVSALAAYVASRFASGDYKEIIVVFNRFVNSFTQRPRRQTIFPLKMMEPVQDKKYYFGEFTIEPSAEEVVAALLPEYSENLLRDAAYSAEASEHSARMLAMKNATENAQGLVTDLTLEYNKLRQQEITLSIADMVTARLAVED